MGGRAGHPQPSVGPRTHHTQHWLRTTTRPKFKLMTMAAALGSATGFTLIPLDRVELRAWAVVRLLVRFIGHIVIQEKHSKKSIPLYGKKSILIPHIIAGLIETFRFSILDLSEDPVPGSVDLLLCLVQSITNLLLVAPLRRGWPSVTRPSYQTGGILRPVMTTIAVLTGDTDLHRSSVYIVDGFLYTRLFIAVLTLCFPNTRYKASIYAIAVTLAGTIASASGCYRNSPVTMALLYAITTFALYHLNSFNRVTIQVPEESYSPSPSPSLSPTSPLLITPVQAVTLIPASDPEKDNEINLENECEIDVATVAETRPLLHCITEHAKNDQVLSLTSSPKGNLHLSGLSPSSVTDALAKIMFRFYDTNTPQSPNMDDTCISPGGRRYLLGDKLASLGFCPLDDFRQLQKEQMMTQLLGHEHNTFDKYTQPVT